MTLRSIFEQMKGTWGRLASGEDSVIHFIRLTLLRQYGFPDLFLRLPQTIGRLYLSLIRRYPFQVYAFTSFDLWLRSYYSKLVRNFREAGRWGYVWDESLGFPMGPRFGSNWATYAVYGALSPQKFSLVSFLLFLLATLILGVNSSNALWQTFILVSMLLTSPVLIFSLVAYTVKPEVIWWWAAIPTFFFAVQNQWTPVWVILGMLLLANTSVAVLMGLIIGGFWVSSLLMGRTGFSPALIWLVPGILVRAWRFLSAYLDGNLGATVQEQGKMSRAVQSRGVDLGRLLYQCADLTWNIFLPCIIAAWPGWISGLILGAFLAGLWFVSLNWFKLADTVTLNIVVACAVVAMALVSGGWINLLGVFLVVMKKPFMYLVQIQGERKIRTRAMDQAESSRKIVQYYASLAAEYPWFSPMPFPAPLPLMNMLGKIPDGTRVLLEGDGNPREQGKFIRFHDWTYGVFPDRRVEFVNHTFLNRMLEPALAEKYLNQLSVPRLTAEGIDDVCFKLGVRYFIACSDVTSRALQQIGYRAEQTLDIPEISEMAALLMIPDVSLTLLVSPKHASIISPDVNIQHKRNSLSWEAEAGVTYIVRYRYYPQFTAFQEKTRLPVEPYHPFDDIPLRFMTVQAHQTGTLELVYGKPSVQ